MPRKKTDTAASVRTSFPYGTNRSAAIRGYLQAHPKATPKEVATALGQEGVAVTTSLISQVKSKLTKGKKRTKRKVRATNSDTTLAILLDVKKLASKHGLEKVKSAVSTFDTLTR